MKNAIGLLFCFLLLVSSHCFSGVLVLSQKLQLDYPDPSLISHTHETLIFKYSDWSFAHELVNPKSIYSKVDLSGIESLFIKSIFDETERKKLPGWLASLSSEQATEFGVTESTIEKKRIGNVELWSVFDESRQSGHIYVFDELVIHHFVVHGSKSHFKDVISNIKER